MVVSVSVEDVMDAVETALPDDTVDELARRFVELGLESIAIVDDGDPIGIVTRSDFVSLIASNELMMQTTREFMSEPLISIEPLTSVHEAAKVLYEHQINQLPVLDNERFIELVTATDLSHFVMDAMMINGVSTPSLESITREELEWSYEYDDEGEPGVSVGDIVTFTKLITENDIELFAEVRVTKICFTRTSSSRNERGSAIESFTAHLRRALSALRWHSSPDSSFISDRP
ncbi:CBS domain-containing protein [Natronorubrum halophilum]|uniref:CBS domain-containing protein n=1 Tax=Natronorubrum halophilum TaxID=1702106 RepID=UPI000EF662B0|nr:CBS domain-containing protein [Natronorubrum halophilum]